MECEKMISKCEKIISKCSINFKVFIQFRNVKILTHFFVKASPCTPPASRPGCVNRLKFLNLFFYLYSYFYIFISFFHLYSLFIYNFICLFSFV